MTANVNTQTTTMGVHTIRLNPVRHVMQPGAARPATTDVGTQTPVSWPPATLMSLPTEMLHHIMGDLLAAALSPVNSPVARTAAVNFTTASAGSTLYPILRPMLDEARVTSALETATTAANVEALLGTSEQPGPLRRLPLRDQERALPRLMVWLDAPNIALPERVTATRRVRDYLANLPQASQAVILQEGLRNPRGRFSPCLVLLLGDSTPGGSPNGTVQALPPHLQTGPLRSLVDAAFGPGADANGLGPADRRQIRAVVHRLPEGIGEDLKRAVGRA